MEQVEQTGAAVGHPGESEPGEFRMPKMKITAAWHIEPGDAAFRQENTTTRSRLYWHDPVKGEVESYYEFGFPDGMTEMTFGPRDEFVLVDFRHSARKSPQSVSFRARVTLGLTLGDAPEQTAELIFEHQAQAAPGSADTRIELKAVKGNPLMFEGNPYELAILCFTEPAMTPDGAESDRATATTSNGHVDAWVWVGLRPFDVTADLRIATVNYRGQAAGQADEYVEIANPGSADAMLTGWKLGAGDTGQDFTFPEFVLKAGQTCRVYTNEVHPEYGGLSYGYGRSVWNDKGDTAELRSPDGTVVATYGYGDQATPGQDSGPETFDRIPGITVALSAGRWVHTALFGDRYVEFTDLGINGQGYIGAAPDGTPGRWDSVLPREFWQDVPVVGVNQDPAGSAVTYVFAKGDDVAFVADGKLVEQTTIAAKWPHTAAWLADSALQALDPVRQGGNPVKYLALAGEKFCFFTDAKMVKSGVIAKEWPFLPAQFMTDVDDAIAVPQSPRWKYMFTKGSEIIFFTDAGIVEGPRQISDKWPALWEWMQQSG